MRLVGNDDPRTWRRGKSPVSLAAPGDDFRLVTPCLNQAPAASPSVPGPAPFKSSSKTFHRLVFRAGTPAPNPPPAGAAKLPFSPGASQRALNTATLAGSWLPRGIVRFEAVATGLFSAQVAPFHPRHSSLCH